ncbi:hypothetical protein B0J12DRAFT_705429 [Macrophomina phaseolina]|uniref:Uncharacterized protein n=1 Tax=Macrophomina phaseolina TaxID=35725 RepID=A0ABQ8FS74_9PEZI|nr:hypothetical protein B0J12DRAFT_705429 [Macrophomina phaseolina]
MSAFLESGKGKQRAESPTASQAGPSAAQHDEEVSPSSESTTEDDISEDERPQRSLSVEHVPPPYEYLFPSGRPRDNPENAGDDPQSDPPATVPTPVTTTPTSHGSTTKPALADASTGLEEASTAKEEGDLGAEPTSAASRKRKRVLFAGEMIGDALGEPLIDDTSQHQETVPQGRSENGFDRTGHDQAIRRARQKAREHMVKRFNTSVAPPDYEISDVVSGQVPPPYRGGKATVLLGVIHEVLFNDKDDHKQYVLQTSFGIVDRPFAANELELLHESMRPTDLDTLTAQTPVSCKAACYRNALAMGTVDPRCNCKAGCHNNRCPCRNSFAKCGRRCHKGAPCSNSGEPEEGQSSIQGAASGSRTRAGREVRPTKKRLGQE